MNLSDLLKQDRVEKFESDKDQIKNELENASAKLKSAKNVLGINEWGLAHTAAYEAMLHAGKFSNSFFYFVSSLLKWVFSAFFLRTIFG